MLWLILSLLTALSAASQDAWTKQFFSHLSPYEMSAYLAIYSTPFYIICLPFISIPSIDNTFWWSVGFSIPIDTIAFVMYMKAIQISPLSLTVPYLAFTPAFMILTGYLFLNEIPNLWGMLGIGIVCMGGYILNIKPGKWSFLAPITAIFKETGSWLMLLVSFMYSFTAVIGKKAILHSSPMFFIMFYCIVFNLILFLLLFIFQKIHLKTFKESPLKGFIVGFLLFLHAFFHSWAISLTKAAYMISVKRLSVVFGVIYGRLLFKEDNIAFRLSGAFLMVIGTAVIMFQGM